MSRTKSKWETLEENYTKNEQGHIFQFLDETDKEGKAQLFGQLASIDLAPIRREVLKFLRPNFESVSLKPASSLRLPVSQADERRWEQAYQEGEAVVRQGKVGIVTVSGGTGTRIGFDHSLGLLPVSPVKNKTLFQILAEKILAAERRYNVSIPWFLMTSPLNHDETEEYFEAHGFFGLSHVCIRPQEMLPTLDLDGKLLLASKSSIAMHPNGHGGFLEAFVNHGLMDDFQVLGVEHLSYLQVDNPLAQPIDPHFIGFHVMENSQMSSRCVRKAYADEKVGVFADRDGKVAVIEYFDLPMDIMRSVDISNNLRFGLANTALHIFRMDFLKDLAEKEIWNQMPFHRAKKRVPFVNERGKLTRPAEINAIKLERFVFDMLPFAERSLLLEGRREEIFSPIKNAAGLDSLETSKRDQIKLFAKWLSEGKAEIPMDSDGLPPFAIEISPLFAERRRTFLSAWAGLEKKPTVCENFYLE